jgi:hypothetical protein
MQRILRFRVSLTSVERRPLYIQYAMKTLEDVRERVVEIIGRREMLPLVNAGVMLSTGISLTADHRPHSLEDVVRVIVALEEMGYAVNGEKTLRGKKKQAQ